MTPIYQPGVRLPRRPFITATEIGAGIVYGAALSIIVYAILGAV
jgi:hypothetical protein